MARKRPTTDSGEKTPVPVPRPSTRANTRARAPPAAVSNPLPSHSSSPPSPLKKGKKIEMKAAKDAAIRVGEAYQAVIPEIRARGKIKMRSYELLLNHSDDLETALKVNPDDGWTPYKNDLFANAFKLYGKAFDKMSLMLPDETVQQLVGQYYREKMHSKREKREKEEKRRKDKEKEQEQRCKQKEEEKEKKEQHCMKEARKAAETRERDIRKAKEGTELQEGRKEEAENEGKEREDRHEEEGGRKKAELCQVVTRRSRRKRMMTDGSKGDTSEQEVADKDRADQPERTPRITSQNAYFSKRFAELKAENPEMKLGGKNLTAIIEKLNLEWSKFSQAEKDSYRVLPPKPEKPAKKPRKSAATTTTTKKKGRVHRKKGQSSSDADEGQAVKSKNRRDFDQKRQALEEWLLRVEGEFSTQEGLVDLEALDRGVAVNGDLLIDVAMSGLSGGAEAAAIAATVGSCRERLRRIRERVRLCKEERKSAVLDKHVQGGLEQESQLDDDNRKETARS